MAKLPKALVYLANLQSELIPEQKGVLIGTKRKVEDYFFQKITDAKKLEDEWMNKEIFEEAMSANLSRDKEEIEELLKKDNFVEFYSALKPIVPENQSIIEYYVLDDKKKNFDRIIENSFQDRHLYKVSQKVFFGTLSTLESK